MRIIAFDRFRDGVSLETIQPFLQEGVSNVWRVWKANIVRENYACADEQGVVIVFEVPDMVSRDANSDGRDTRRPHLRCGCSDVQTDPRGNIVEPGAVVSHAGTEHRSSELEEEILRLQQVVCELLLANQHLRFLVARHARVSGELP